MHRHTLSDTGEMASSRSSRAPSFSSDRPSAASSITFQMPTTVRPAPAYIAASVASQIVTDHHNAQLREEDDDADELENAIFSEQALSLLNAFLDHLLFAFLSSARSPSLTAVRPAISDVLKPRLAREATESADEELQGLLAGEDDEISANDGQPVDKWDVEKVWKRTRLRIMVYTRLGELEDEDEEKYVQQERGLSMDEDEDDEAGLVSWASAIFLTSVIEYIAEQTLLVSGSAAYARMAAKLKKLQQQVQDTEEASFERIVVEEPDAEKIALNSALGRLWRTWRKRVRSPLSPISPGRGIRSVASWGSLHRRKMSHDTIDGSLRGEQEPIPERIPTETEIAANIPLPVGDNDVNEIEVPGLANTFEADSESTGTQTPVPRNQRPSSVIMLAPVETFRRRATKPRPVSMPHPPASEFTVPVFSERASDPPETPFETPMEYATKRTSYMAHEQPAAVPQHTHNEEREALESPQTADAEMLAFAANTGLGFRMSTVNPIKTEVPAKTEDEPEIPSAGGYESEPKIMQSKRMSVEKTGPPGIVRTFSTRSSSRSAQHTPVASPMLPQQADARSYLDDAETTDDEPERTAIGVARTSDIPIRSTPTPDMAAHGGYVEVQPRQTSISSISARNTPSPDAKPITPDRSVARKDLHKRELSGGAYAAAGASQLGNITSAPRQQAPPKSRGASLPSLQEAESPNARRNKTTSEASPTQTPTQRKPVQAGRDARANTLERQAQNKSAEETKRTPHATLDGSPSSEKSAVQRVSSTSSKKSSIHARNNGRDSEASQRSAVRSRMSEEDRERQFESLVNAEETVKFTLTPQTDSQPPLQRKIETHRPTTSKSSVTVHPRVNADKDNSFGTGHLPSRSSSRSKGPVAAPQKSSPSRKVVGRQLAREPRIEQESMRDFADFIRSTGPSPGQDKPVQPFVNISGNGPRSTNASSSSLGRKTSTRQNSTRGTEGPSASGKPRVNMEPRSPAGLSTGNDDLIDFIRQGPPNAPNGQPRIPRNVAPFRTTVDSDQFDQMLGGNNVESAYGSTASTLDSKHSTQTINSRTGLIPEPKVVQPAYSNQPQKLSGNMASNNQEPVITRTRRRVKDPYAIDISDEEDDDEDEDQLTALPPSTQPPGVRQESLMDFLNGMDPPSTSKPEPFVLSPETIAAAKARANTSSSSLSSTTTGPRNGPQNYGAISSTSVASDAHRAYKPRLQARAPAVSEVRTSKTATSDLADFLRNSGPPEHVVPSQPVEEKKKSRKFWRREKTYGDLP
ncbi:hypothetical protein HBI37_219180 [Parastagonospora nodorum]|nr:hypothetical protein HBH71_219290 [Parastagonospora nodorum]KAH5465122.1 hypothetical protein HBI28_233370 [Parastagonospora nodorum]KAH5667266.1 hypothetical protein HBI21_222410 [Parastagonospora nodorum]KAH6325131.1 hypothetical protein HBI37_219180 [Parastagonospora nodorum]